eukprot:Platyproteum_vivax@DN7209_c0_g1_i3.p1
MDAYSDDFENDTNNGDSYSNEQFENDSSKDLVIEEEPIIEKQLPREYQLTIVKKSWRNERFRLYHQTPLTPYQLFLTGTSKRFHLKRTIGIQCGGLDTIEASTGTDPFMTLDVMTQAPVLSLEVWRDSWPMYECGTRPPPRELSVFLKNYEKFIEACLIESSTSAALVKQAPPVSPSPVSSSPVLLQPNAKPSGIFVLVGSPTHPNFIAVVILCPVSETAIQSQLLLYSLSVTTPTVLDSHYRISACAVQVSDLIVAGSQEGTLLVWKSVSNPTPGASNPTPFCSRPVSSWLHSAPIVCLAKDGCRLWSLDEGGGVSNWKVCINSSMVVDRGSIGPLGGVHPPGPQLRVLSLFGNCQAKRYNWVDLHCSVGPE